MLRSEKSGFPMPDPAQKTDMSKALRILTEMNYSEEGVPMSGQCGYCRQLFSTSVEALSDTGKATQDFYTAFLRHECSDTKGED
jgi:hypothetical protein